MSRAPGCVFCTIANDDPHGQVLDRWPDAVLIEPLNPVTPGHRLVIPLVHVADATTDPLVTGAAMACAARYVGKFLHDDANIITSVGADATQTVFHLHLHVVPRRAGDGLTLPWTPPPRPRGKRCVGCGYCCQSTPAQSRGAGHRGCQP